MSQIVSVIGLGKAGLPLAAVIANEGLEVMGVDLDEKRVEMINAGQNPLQEEPGLGDLLANLGGKTLSATADTGEAIKKSTAHIIIVPLFIDKNKEPDFSAIDAASSAVGKNLKKGDLVVLETSVPVGTTEGRLRENLEDVSGLKAGKDFFLAYSPERIMTGHSISRYQEFPKLVGGVDEKSTEKALSLYQKFAKPIAVSSARVAELAKLAEGVYRDVNIALANELYRASEHYGVDFWEMREAARHEFCNILEPGNVGGHCIPVYPWFLIKEMDLPLLKEARDVNDSMVSYYANKADSIGGKRACVVGLSYREGVKEKAYSRSVAMIAELKKRGYEVYGNDPLYSAEETNEEFGVPYADDFESMDVIILMNKESSLKERLGPLKEKVVDVKKVLA